VKVIDDGSLTGGEGWAMARCEATDDLYFLVERSAASDEQTLHNAWKAAANLVIEEAVRQGIVEWVHKPGA
jgi:hypothetical protein